MPATIPAAPAANRCDNADWLEGFRAWLAAGDRSPRTLRSYVTDIQQFAAWYEATEGRPFEPALLTVAVAAEYKAYLRRLGRRPATINRALASLRLLARYAGVQLEGLRAAPEQELAPRSLPAAAVDALIAAARRAGLRDLLLVAIIADVGLRVGEVVGLRAGDVELPRGGNVATLRVRGKGAKVRHVPLPVETTQLLRRWLRQVRPDPGQPLFPGRRSGEPLTTKAVRQVFKRLARAAGLDPQEVHPHRLRHTCATEWLRNGARLDDVAALLGHARLDTTARYTRSSLEDLRALVEQVRRRR